MSKNDFWKWRAWSSTINIYQYNSERTEYLLQLQIVKSAKWRKCSSSFWLGPQNPIPEFRPGYQILADESEKRWRRFEQDRNLNLKKRLGSRTYFKEASLVYETRREQFRERCFRKWCAYRSRRAWWQRSWHTLKMQSSGQCPTFLDLTKINPCWTSLKSSACLTTRQTSPCLTSLKSSHPYS